MVDFFTRLATAWNVFKDGKEDPYISNNYGYGLGSRPDINYYNYGNAENVLIASIFTKISMDVASNNIFHVLVDSDNNFKEIFKSELNNCLTVEANIDQNSRAFIQDVVMSLCDEGNIAIVPVDITTDPNLSNSWDIITMRCGKILQWYPQHVEVEVYNDRTGFFERIILSKRSVAIVENPLFPVMNEPNSTLRRLVEKLNLLDIIDRQSGSQKLDLIFQLPFSARTELRQAQAEVRRKAIEDQLVNSQYGIAYIDASERITQLNRPAGNNLLQQIEYLTRMLYSQLGLTEGVFLGTASQDEMHQYYNRTIEPILSAITLSMDRIFITKTARGRGHKIMHFVDPFKFVLPADIPDLADKLTRNEILSSNEVRSKLGMRPSDDPKANELRNKNLNEPEPSNNIQNGIKIKE